MILVEPDRPGVFYMDVGAKMGITLSYTAEVNFKDVRVSVSNLVGKENRGFYQVLEFFDESRIFASFVGPSYILVF